MNWGLFAEIIGMVVLLGGFFGGGFLLIGWLANRRSLSQPINDASGQCCVIRRDYPPAVEIDGKLQVPARTMERIEYLSRLGRYAAEDKLRAAEEICRLLGLDPENGFDSAHCLRIANGGDPRETIAKLNKRSDRVIDSTCAGQEAQGVLPSTEIRAECFGV